MACGHKEMSKKPKTDTRYITHDGRRVTLLEDHREVVLRQIDGEEPQPMRRDLFERWVKSVSGAKA